MRIKALLCVLLFTCLSSIAVAAPHVESLRSPQGLPALAMVDHSLPMAVVQFTFPYAGALSDPALKQGRAHFGATMLSEGSGDYNAQAFRKALEDRAIQLSVSASTDFLVIRLKSLSEHLPEAIRLTGLMLRSPRFDAQAASRIRQKLLSTLKQSEESPGWHASRQWDILAYGDHPYSYSSIGTHRSLTAITPDDLSEWHHDVVTRDQLVISIVGDVETAPLMQQLDAALAGMPATRSLPLPSTAPALPEHTEPHIITRDIPQTIALFGLPSLPRSHPDFYAAYVMNYILGGGGLTSRLSEEIRQQRGLAYHASSGLSPMLLSDALLGSFATRNEQAGKALHVMEDVLHNAGINGFTDAEVANAKHYIIGSFPLDLDSQQSRVNYLNSMQVFGLKADYLQQRNAFFKAVTRDDVNRVARTLLAPRPLSVLVGQPEGVTP